MLDSRLKYERVAVAANESQFLETTRAAAAEIAISFNLPPDKINAAASGSTITYANREQNEQQYLIDSINPDLVVIQETMSLRALPGTMYARWNTAAFLRSDMLTRYKAHGMALRDGWRNADEVRALEEEDAIPNGDIYLWPHIPQGAAASHDGGTSA